MYIYVAPLFLLFFHWHGAIILGCNQSGNHSRHIGADADAFQLSFLCLPANPTTQTRHGTKTIITSSHTLSKEYREKQGQGKLDDSLASSSMGRRRSRGEGMVSDIGVRNLLAAMVCI